MWGIGLTEFFWSMVCNGDAAVLRRRISVFSQLYSKNCSPVVGRISFFAAAFGRGPVSYTAFGRRGLHVITLASRKWVRNPISNIAVRCVRQCPVVVVIWRRPVSSALLVDSAHRKSLISPPSALQPFPLLPAFRFSPSVSDACASSRRFSGSTLTWLSLAVVGSQRRTSNWLVDMAINLHVRGG